SGRGYVVEEDRPGGAVSTAERRLDELHQVFHHEAWLRADVYRGAAAAEIVGDDGADGRHARPRQSLFEKFAEISLGGDFVQPIHLRGAGEDDAIDSAGGELRDESGDFFAVGGGSIDVGKHGADGRA